MLQFGLHTPTSAGQLEQFSPGSTIPFPQEYWFPSTIDRREFSQLISTPISGHPSVSWIPL